MSDTVKLIIEIDKDKYERCKERKLWSYDAEILEGAVAMGIPLDTVKAEIDNEWANTHHMYPEYAGGLARASEIIDKHIGKAESKIHCNCTDEEIAKSFIEDCCEAQGHLWADNNIFEDVEENQ